MAEIEIWCGQTANRVYAGQMIWKLPDDKVRLMDKWLDGSLHDTTVEIEPGSLEKSDYGWIAILRESAKPL